MCRCIRCGNFIFSNSTRNNSTLLFMKEEFFSTKERVCVYVTKRNYRNRVDLRRARRFGSPGISVTHLVYGAVKLWNRITRILGASFPARCFMDIESQFIYFVYSILIGGAYVSLGGKFFIVVLLSLFSPATGEVKTPRGGRKNWKI